MGATCSRTGHSDRRANRSRPAGSKAATSSGSTPTRWWSAAVTGRTTRASDSCGRSSARRSTWWSCRFRTGPAERRRHAPDVAHQPGRLPTWRSSIRRLLPVPFREWLLATRDDPGRGAGRRVRQHGHQRARARPASLPDGDGQPAERGRRSSRPVPRSSSTQGIEISVQGRGRADVPDATDPAPRVGSPRTRAIHWLVIRSVAVLGAGVMGAQIAAHFANAGVPVLLLDITPAAAADGSQRSGHEARSVLHRRHACVDHDGRLRRRPRPRRRRRLDPRSGRRATRRQA